jgi:hypothetical protein
VTSTKKVAILILSSAAGTVIIYGVFLFAGLGLLMLYGDNGHPPKFLEYSLFYKVFGITTLLGFGLSLFSNQELGKISFINRARYSTTQFKSLPHPPTRFTLFGKSNCPASAFPVLDDSANTVSLYGYRPLPATVSRDSIQS